MPEGRDPREGMFKLEKKLKLMIRYSLVSRPATTVVAGMKHSRPPVDFLTITMQIFMKTLTGAKATLTLKTESCNTIHNLKAKIQDSVERWVFKKRLITDVLSISVSYNISTFFFFTDPASYARSRFRRSSVRRQQHALGLWHREGGSYPSVYAKPRPMVILMLTLWLVPSSWW